MRDKKYFVVGRMDGFNLHYVWETGPFSKGEALKRKKVLEDNQTAFNFIYKYCHDNTVEYSVRSE